VANLGFVGLGVMGSLMAERLLEKKHSLTGYNRTRAKAQSLIDKGMKFAETPRAVAEAAEVIFSSVANSAALTSIAEGPNGILAGLSRGKIFVDMSTVGVATSRAIAAKVREKGADMLDAPVSGSVATLKVGRMSLIVGGKRETFDLVKPLLEDFSDQPAAGGTGPKVTYVGENGLALVMKIATNSNLAVQMLAFSEAVLLAEKSGIPRQTAVDVLTHSAIASPMVQYRGPFVLKLPETAWFDVNMMQKDMLLALELGRQVDVPLPAAAAANEMLTSARAIGLVHEDFAVMFDALAKMSGVPR
jgi:3-hydroxyisobutyrate dehydrogenase-like beta-hydroxyacid dehydrogenase